jgi:hypothetical protein
MLFSPETTKPMREFVEVLLRGPQSTLTPQNALSLRVLRLPASEIKESFLRESGGPVQRHEPPGGTGAEDGRAAFQRGRFVSGLTGEGF